MDKIVCDVLDKVEHNQEVINVMFNINEFNSVNVLLDYICDYFIEYRDSLESKNADIPIQSSIFIDSLISACNKLDMSDDIQNLH